MGAGRFVDALGVDFKRTGEVYVRTASGLRYLSSRTLSSELPPLELREPECHLDRIVSDIIPSLAEFTDWHTLQINVNGNPIATIELQKPSLAAPSMLRKWVVTNINPIVFNPQVNVHS